MADEVWALFSYEEKDPVEPRKPRPEHCSYCDIPNPGDMHWKWDKDSRYRHGGKWRCREYIKHHGRLYAARRKADPERRAKLEAYQRAYHLANPEYARYKAYRSVDKKRGWAGPLIPWAEAKPLMLADCSYCGGPGGGLDRTDGSKGHVSGNCVPACANCNLVLLDMPVELKKLFMPALQEARKNGLLNSWKHPRLRNLTQPAEQQERPGD